jgi:NAD(P)-dependent dehydrogenase (short-subunit alcohol dehydrogenase family)
MTNTEPVGRVLVTGGSMGLGRACAQRLAGDGWSVTIAARGAGAIEETLASLPGRGHRGLRLDVSKPDDWASCVDELAALDALVHAAAVIGPIGPVEQIEPSEFLEVLRINVLGTLLAVQTCLPSLRASSGRVVVFSGGGATAPLPRFDAYAASKAATVRLVENLACEDIPINAVAPGLVATRMHDATLAAGPDRAGRDYYERTKRDLTAGGAPPAAAAALVAWLVTREADGISGKLISAVWDPWEDQQFRHKLRHDPNFATVRRIDGQTFIEA